MRIRFIVLAAFMLTLAACAWIPKLDAQGQPVLDPLTGEPETELVLDTEAVDKAVAAGAPFLPFPFDLLAVAGLGFASMLRKETA